MQREFGPKNFNRAPVKGYSTQPRTNIQNNLYVSPAEQGQQWARRERRDYQAAYGELDPSWNATLTLERSPLGNEDLPIADKKGEISESIRNNPVTIILGETGSGKSTQVVQMGLELNFERVIQTQPRRIAAVTLADRIGDEITRRWPDAPRDISAYHTGERSTATDNTRIINVTAGVMFAQDIHNRPRVDSELIILDEVHEREMVTNINMAIARQALLDNPGMRLVIQSATMDPGPIQEYFGKALGVDIPVIEVEGRTFGVDIQEFPQDTSVQRAVARATEMFELDKRQKEMVADGYEGPLLPTDFLVVCPGRREISDWTDEILEALPDEIAQSSVILPLHSKMSPKDQQKALKTGYPGLKIIMATNTAKTSLTIDGLAGIIDCGYARHQVVDENGVVSLALYETSYADRMQWAGRSGRTAPGWCDQTRMNEDMPFTPLLKAEAYETPEAQRINPDSYVLGLAAIGIDLATLETPDWINPAAIARAKENLRVLGAFDDNYEITSMGRRMTEFPIDQPTSARMLAEADQYSPQVRAYMAAIVASHEAGGLQLFTHEAGRRWKGENGLTEEESSDLLAQLDIFIAIQDMNSYKQQKYDLDIKNIERAKETFWKILRRNDGQTDSLVPPTQEQREEILNCIYAGMPDFIYRYAGANKAVGLHTYTGVSKDMVTPRSLSNRSVVMGKHPFVVGTPRLTERYVAGQRVEKPIIETITRVDDIGVLGRVALSQCEWKQEGNVKWRDGRPTLNVRQFFKGIDLGRTEEREAEPSELTRNAVIAYALAHPGEAQQSLRTIKAQLEHLAHLTTEPVAQLTQDELVGRVRQAAPDDILDPFMIDVNLHQMGITIDTYISAERREQIITNAPAQVPAGGVTFPVTYQSGRPLIRRYDNANLVHLPDSVQLPDGREVKFVYERKEYTAGEIKSIMGY
ncbi:MAG TPA: helicase-related protein [Candidatus Saccharimonadales bacterium]|nr:helicase-related protein [Candidatus Saccharimonadales bacterium]